MTFQRSPRSIGHSPAPSLLSRAGIALVLLLVALSAVALSAACGGDDTTTNNFIGVTDAEPPRLGIPPDAGRAR